MKNRKIELDDSLLMQLIKKLRYKTVTDFFADIANGKNDVNWVIDRYLEMGNKEQELKETHASISAEEFTLKTPDSEVVSGDELIIGQNLTGVIISWQNV